MAPWPWLLPMALALVGASPPVADIGAQRRSRVSELPRAPEAAFESTGGGQLVAFVEGMDAASRPMSEGEAAQKLRDPFATLVLRKGVFPRTLAEVLKALNDRNGDAGSVPQQRNFLVGEGSQIPFDPAAAQPNRSVRFVVARARAGDTRVLISTAAGGPPGGFLQLIAWDADAGSFNFYGPGRGDLVVAGSSKEALTGATRGQGCFRCHVNGAPVMKELKKPWNNWKSQNTTVSAGILPPDSPLRTDPMFLRPANGEELESEIIRAGVRRWDAARVPKMLVGGEVRDAPTLLRQLFDSTTVNLVSSPSESRANTPQVLLPLEFFLNRDALFNVVGLASPPEFQPPSVPRDVYRAALQRFEFALASGAFRQPGDTHFAFLVPEPAFEDVNALREMLARKLIDRKFAASVLMVDFPNPVFSPARRRLLEYIPTAGTIRPDGSSDLPERIAEAIAEAAKALPVESPERQFLANWGLPDADWEATYASTDPIVPRCRAGPTHQAGGIRRYVELAESAEAPVRPTAAERVRAAPAQDQHPRERPPPADGRRRGRRQSVIRPNPALRGSAGPTRRESTPMALLPQFDPPADIDDMDATQRRRWSEFIDSLMEQSRQGDPEGARPQFYNPTRTDTAADAATVDISWRAFPNIIALTSASDRERWTRAEASRDVQDEYCEWSVARDPATGKITRVTFTCESPEYWQFLAAVDPAKVLELYQQYVTPA